MTDTQTFASDPRHSVWVAASAGTGKTKVLTERVLRLMLEGVSPAKILCLTFTKAAASEMANRINEELGKWVLLSDTLLRTRIHTLSGTVPNHDQLLFARRLFCTVLDTPDRLKIQTIHSFCQSLMERFPLEAGIAPHFEIIDDRSAEALLEEARLLLLGRASPDPDHPITAAIRVMAYMRPDKRLTELLREIISKRSDITMLIDFYGGVEATIEALYQQSDIALGLTEDTLLSTAFHNDAIGSMALAESADILLQSSARDQEQGKALKQWLQLSLEERCRHHHDYFRIFLTAQMDKKADAYVITGSLAKKYPSIRDILLQEQERVYQLWEQLKTLRTVLFTAHLLHISAGLLAEYKQLKSAQGYLDYQDLIMKTTSLLRQDGMNQWILYKLDEGIDHILLDEAQDTSPEQWQIIRNLCDEFFAGEGVRDTHRTVFVVGDEKQSIFSFQGADPESFTLSRDAFSEKARQAQQPFHHVALDISFRSTEAVLKLVDSVFAPEELRAAITSSGSITHHAHRRGQGGTVELWPPIYTQENDGRKILPDRHLAELIAEKIHHWLTHGEILPSAGRPIQAGDILVLIRRRNAFSYHLVKALKDRMIEVAGMDRLSLTEHLGIMDLIALGNFLLLPQDDLTLATILKSPLIGLSEEDLFTLAYNRTNSLWQRLKEHPDYTEAARYLTELLAKTDYCSPFELYSTIIEVRGGRANLCSRLGNEVGDPLDEFLSLTLAYEQSHVPSLQGFLHWLGSGKTDIKRDLEQGKNQVRIMTVHGAKGLQAPIVFMPDTMQLSKDDNELLLSNSLIYWQTSAKNIPLSCQKWKEKQQQKTFQEYVRLLYVALTRAEDHLIICGYSGKDESEHCWYSLIKKGLLPFAEEHPFAGGQTPMLRYSCPQTVPARDTKHVLQMEPSHAPLPSFLLSAAKDEPTPPTPLVPSAASDTEPSVRSPLAENNRFPRGNIMHQLLQLLPALTHEQQQLAAKVLLRGVDPIHAKEMLDTVLSILHHPQFAAVFAIGSIAEAPITGLITTRTGPRVISGRIDRLVVTEKEVLIIDYKTNRVPPKTTEHIPSGYVRQMAAYYALLKDIYPQKTIRCALLWTETPLLMPIPESMVLAM